MAGINLSGVTRYIESNLLLDTVRVAETGAGDPVFNETTGEYDYPDPVTVYEGPGMVQAVGTPGGISAINVTSLPWQEETHSKYQLLTPLDAPVPDAQQLVTVLAVHAGGDAALIGRRWRTQDPGRAGTLSVVRITPLDQENTGGSGGA